MVCERMRIYRERMSETGHPRRDHLDGMSAIAPIATESLQYGNGRKGPLPDQVHRSKNRVILYVGGGDQL